MIFFGIDISKLTFDVTVLIESKSKHKKFDNNSQGFLGLGRSVYFLQDLKHIGS